MISEVLGGDMLGPAEDPGKDGGDDGEGRWWGHQTSPGERQKQRESYLKRKQDDGG